MLWLLDSERFYNIPLWDCLQQILLKTLPPNISLSFEGEFDIWKLSKDLTYKEPSVMYEVWVICLGPKQGVTPNPVGLHLRSLPGTAVTKTRHTKSRHLCHLYLRFPHSVIQE